MALKDTWIDKVDNVDEIKSSDINNIAEAVIALEDEPDIIADNVMSDVSENPVQNKVVKKYVDDNVEYIHNSYGWMGDAIGGINMQLETLGMNVAENGGAINNLTDRILNVETNKADISYVDNAISSAIDEALEGDY